MSSSGACGTLRSGAYVRGERRRSSEPCISELGPGSQRFPRDQRVGHCDGNESAAVPKRAQSSRNLAEPARVVDVRRPPISTPR